MPRVHLRLIVALLALTLVASTTRFATAQRQSVDVYAITNARIVTVSGQTIDRGTLVIRNGLIAGVGNVQPPADARVIDGTGLIIYPGLIDAYTNLGLPEPVVTTTQGAGGGAGAFLLAQLAPRPAPTGPNSTQPAGLQPEVMVEDDLRTGGADLEGSRNAGITAALSVPRSGIWMGQSALINLAGETPQQMVIKSPVAMHVGFTPLRGSYPGSLMGVFAQLRQMMLDAQRYRDSLAIYDRSPRGNRRPDTDKSLAALVPVINGQMPVVMVANSEREIERALDLAEEFKLKLIISGGRESGRLTDRLAKANVPVLLSLNLPRRTTAALPESEPEPMRTLRERVEAQKTAGVLAKAKVRFAFQSGSLGNMSELLANAGRTIENGLSAEDALRAFTIWPAEILGARDQLGTIETGKIANLTVMRGDLFDRNSRVAHVFIDGKPVELRPVPAGLGGGFGPGGFGPGGPGGPGGPARSLTGQWTLNVTVGPGPKTATLNLTQEGDSLRGAISGAFGAAEISNASTGAEIRFTVPLNIEGQTKEGTFTGTLTGNEIRGTVTIVGSSPGTFTATRSGQPN